MSTLLSLGLTPLLLDGLRHRDEQIGIAADLRPEESRRPTRKFADETGNQLRKISTGGGREADEAEKAKEFLRIADLAARAGFSASNRNEIPLQCIFTVYPLEKGNFSGPVT